MSYWRCKYLLEKYPIQDNRWQLEFAYDSVTDLYGRFVTRFSQFKSFPHYEDFSVITDPWRRKFKGKWIPIYNYDDVTVINRWYAITTVERGSVVCKVFNS